MTDKLIRKALGLVEAFRQELDPELSTQTVSAFLYIALNPGMTVKDLEVKLGMSDAAASRNAWRLVSKNQRGFGVVEYRDDPEDRRRKELHLTPKGLKLLSSVLSTMKEGA
jgi:DNA-binding MarR family transcriptional regulator